MLHITKKQKLTLGAGALAVTAGYAVIITTTVKIIKEYKRKKAIASWN